MLKKSSKRFKQLMTSKEMNAEFEKASAPMKRIMIAKDVLEQIRVNNIEACSGDYFVLEDDNIWVGETDKNKVGLQDAFLHIPESCNVCALGGLFYSAIAINNKYKLDVDNNEDGELAYISDGSLRKRVGRFFSNYQLGLIETAFESCYHMNDNGFSTYDISEAKRKEIERAHEFGQGIDDDKTMKNIMKNIIKNEGIFKP
jgi:hypothetical protein